MFLLEKHDWPHLKSTEEMICMAMTCPTATDWIYECQEGATPKYNPCQQEKQQSHGAEHSKGSCASHMAVLHTLHEDADSDVHRNVF